MEMYFVALEIRDKVHTLKSNKFANSIAKHNTHKGNNVIKQSDICLQQQLVIERLHTTHHAYKNTVDVKEHTLSTRP